MDETAVVSNRRCLIPRPRHLFAVAALLLLIGACIWLAVLHLWGDYHRRAARAALERYHTTEAVPHLRAWLKVWPHDPEALFLAARAARRMREFDRADSYLDHCQQFRGMDDEDLVLERAFVRAERGELDKVRKLCEALMHQDHPATPLVQEALARGYLRMERPRDAEWVLEKWLQRQPENPQAIFLHGQMHELNSRFRDAITDYRHVLTVDAEIDEARLRLCAILVEQGPAEEALPHLEYLSRSCPENLMVQVYLARGHDQLGRPDEADKVLEIVLTRQADFAPALAERGKLARRAGRFAEAEKWLRQVVALQPRDLQSHYQLFLCLAGNGNSEEAQKMQARLKQLEDDFQRAQDISRMKLRQKPHDPNLYYELGVIALRMGARESGLRWLQHALKEDPDHEPTHKALMEHYLGAGDFGLAAKHRRKAGPQPMARLPLPGNAGHSRER
jgi:tetratricopeptide (TPR) repeat protein